MKSRKDSTSPPVDTNADLPAPVVSHFVAIGASAGGLEAIETFFKNMPPRTGLAFIVIQHLSPDYKSLMVELLSKKTEMPVVRAEDGVQILPDHVYLIPPRKNMTIFHGRLMLTDQDSSRGINLPIDIFLRSLSEDQGEKAVAVILSGTGSDGARGVRSIKENGGMVIVQTEESARFDGMPRAAAATGLCDYILPPEDMPSQLMAFISHPYSSAQPARDRVLSDDEELARVFAVLREKNRVDFTYYKPSTIKRRIERRMTINRVDSIKDYVAYLLKFNGESQALFRELLIGVTSFFRDQAVFERLLSDVLPQVLKNNTGREVRFWVAGCSTGEEAYSLAICIRECMDTLGLHRDVKIFATDIDKDAIAFASIGAYPESVAADLNPEYLSRYFYRHDESFQVTRAIREMVVFAQHNLIKDPPFTNIDLISCRNLLIYLQPVLQNKVLDFFNFSLRPGGILLLGSSETTGDMAEYFENMDPHLKIYKGRGRTRAFTEHRDIVMAGDTRAREIRDRISYGRRSGRLVEEERIQERLLNSLQPDFIRLALVTNEQMEALYILGDTTGILQLPSGRLTSDITRMACRELSIPLATGIQKAFRLNQEVRFTNIKLTPPGGPVRLEMLIRPLSRKKGQEDLAAVILTPQREKLPRDSDNPESTYDLTREAEQRIRDLEQELQFSRENLQATIEELETSNEELQATNEELLASNEELQSTNEELQSTNEELFTVNAEYHRKIIELTELHNDVNNLLSAAHIGQLILDENMEVRRFSPQVTSIFRLMETDIGRPITHISHSLVDADLEASILAVEKSRKPAARQVLSSDGRVFLMRVLPYFIGPGSFSGTLLSFADITDVIETENALKTSQSRYKELFDTMNQGVTYQDRDGRITAANPAALRILGLTMDQITGRTSMDPGWKAMKADGSNFPGSEHPAMQALSTGRPVKDVIMGVYNPQENMTRWIKVSSVPAEDPDTGHLQVYSTFEDITELRNSGNARDILETQYRTLFENMPDGFMLLRVDKNTDDSGCSFHVERSNPVFDSLTGWKQNTPSHTCITENPEFLSGWESRITDCLNSRSNSRFITGIKNMDAKIEVNIFPAGDSHVGILAHRLADNGQGTDTL